uniref:Uncharacterized protein n=1 Tax=Anguilla anguilla TaxID=7936 RepID=A0A0E9X069_ANGAN
MQTYDKYLDLKSCFVLYVTDSIWHCFIDPKKMILNINRFPYSHT